LTVDVSGVAAAKVDGDEAMLNQVVRNLVDNAARHAIGRVSFGLAESAGTVVLRVDDDGAGVPLKDRERIFERFVRLDEARARQSGGSGLGLAIVRVLVAAHTGEITVGDSPLGGARFEVRVPVASDVR